MPEGPEVETENLHEAIKEELEREWGSLLKLTALTTAVLAALAAGNEPPPALAEDEKRYAVEQEEIRKKALEKEKERDEKSKEAEELIHRHSGFANAVALLLARTFPS